MLHHDYDWKGYKDAIEAVKKVRSENCKIGELINVKITSFNRNNLFGIHQSNKVKAA